jgi:hypothetical protein
MEQGHRTELRRTSCPGTMRVVAGLATLLLVSTGVSGTAMAQMSSTPPSPSPQTPDQPRDRAPIGHRQPRPQDLPPAVRHEEGGTMGATPDERAIDKKLEICRKC